MSYGGVFLPHCGLQVSHLLLHVNPVLEINVFDQVISWCQSETLEDL